MATRAYIGARFYDLSGLIKENQVFVLSSSRHALLSYKEFNLQLDEILDASNDHRYGYIEPEDATQFN